MRFATPRCVAPIAFARAMTETHLSGVVICTAMRTSMPNRSTSRPFAVTAARNPPMSASTRSRSANVGAANLNPSATRAARASARSLGKPPSFIFPAPIHIGTGTAGRALMPA